MQQSISFSLIIIPLCQTKLEKSSLNVISFSVRSSPARFSPPRSERSLQKFSCKAFTSSTWQIASNLLLQDFHLIDREDRFQTFSCKAFTSSIGSPINLATVSRVLPPARRLRTPDMALSSKRPIFANIIKIVELRLGLGDSNRVCP